MNIDMHCHSTASDDSRATVEQYLKWIGAQRKKGYRIDGIVLTEHRQFNHDADYSALAQQYDVLVLKGAELDTKFGHFLVYGIDKRLTDLFNFKDVAMDSHALLAEVRRCGGFAVPAHPGRHGIGLVEWMAEGEKFPEVTVVEKLNAGNRSDEQVRADKLVEEMGYKGIGGSDAHFVSAVAKGMTQFPDGIRDEKDLVSALLEGDFRPVLLEDTHR
jgi:predicted metal-dependent phosphoesterase TrpH